MSTTVTEQGVSALLNMGAQLEQLTEKIHQEAAKLRSAYDDNKEGLGPHSESILKLLEEVEQAETNATIPVKKLVLKLQRAAAVRKGIIENNRYAASKSGGKTR